MFREHEASKRGEVVRRAAQERAAAPAPSRAPAPLVFTDYPAPGDVPAIFREAQRLGRNANGR